MVLSWKNQIHSNLLFLLETMIHLHTGLLMILIKHLHKELQFGYWFSLGKVDVVVEDKDQSVVLRSNGIALMQFEVNLKIYYWKNNKIHVFLHRIYPY